MKIRLWRLALGFGVAMAAWLGVEGYGAVREAHPRHEAMTAAARSTAAAFAVVDSVKRAEGHAYPRDSTVPWRAMLGEDYTPMTTTLGSREAKEVTTNPGWASVLVRLLLEAGVRPGDPVAILASGSFPALALAAAAAVHALGAEPVLLASLGASSYGANGERATMLDLVRWVREAGVLDAGTVLVTAGGEDDIGGGLPDEGLAWLEAAAQRNHVVLARYGSLAAAIAARMGLLADRQPAAIINIGGGQAALGACSHAATLPVGLWRGSPGCDCPARGVLVRAAAQGLPVIHLLNVRGLAALYGLDFEPGGRYRNAGSITTVARPRRGWIVAALAVVVLALAGPRRAQS